MKKKKILFLLSILISFLLATQANGQNVNIGMQIIDSSGPIISLINPINNSGSISGNLSFYYNASDATGISNCSLIINNRINSTNRTLIPQGTAVFFELNNSPAGNYNWSINCTDSFGFIGESPENKLSIFSFSGFNGSTTNLSLVDVRNITNFVAEITNYGKINFSQDVDISQNPDLDSYINISQNRIAINSSSIPALNKPAVLQLAGLAFSNPRILRDGSVCSGSICTRIAYSGGRLTFSVNQWSAYSSEETPAEAETASNGGGGSGGGGGGGGMILPFQENFEVSPKFMQATAFADEAITKELAVTNTGESPLKISISVQGIENIIEIDEANFELGRGQSKSLKLAFNAPEPGNYSGKIIVKSANVQKEITVEIEVIKKDVSAVVEIADEIVAAVKEGRLPQIQKLTRIENPAINHAIVAAFLLLVLAVGFRIYSIRKKDRN